MTTILLGLGTEDSPWTTYLFVGVVVGILGVLVFFLAGGTDPPSGGIVYGSFLLSLVLIALGVATALGSLAVRRRDARPDPVG